MGALRVAAFVLGVGMIWGTLSSAVHTFVLPRGFPVRLGRLVFIAVRLLFHQRIRLSDGEYLTRDRIMSMYAPSALLGMAVTWVLVILIGFTLIFWALDVTSASSCVPAGQCRYGIGEAFVLSGAALTTVGFERPDQLRGIVVSFIEAGIGLGIVALFIAYLPTIYGAFTRRESAVAMLDGLAGAPVSPLVMLIRYHVIAGLDQLDDLWRQWRSWFAEVEESHTSISAVVFFRSPVPERSWVTAAGCVMDAAALRAACLDLPRSANAELCIRAGYVCLRRIGDFYAISYNPDPDPTDPISITRAEFDEAWDKMASRSLPLKADRDQAWRDFSGWRVNYDTVLLALCALTMAPPAMWSGDRQPPYTRPPLIRRKAEYSRAAMQEPR